MAAAVKTKCGLCEGGFAGSCRISRNAGADYFVRCKKSVGNAGVKKAFAGGGDLSAVYEVSRWCGERLFPICDFERAPSRATGQIDQGIEKFLMERLGKNLGKYLGETIDIRAVLKDVEAAARQHGWSQEIFYDDGEFKWFGLHRDARDQTNRKRFYISAGIHGDEPGSPMAALKLLQDNRWPDHLEVWLCPCLNPVGFTLNTRTNAKGIDLNRAYLNSQVEEILAHIAWLERQPMFDLTMPLHEDWESSGFYLYEQNPDKRPSFAEKIIEAVEKVCPIDRSEVIEGRPASGGILRPNIDPRSRPDWPEAFYLITQKTRQGYTVEAPSDFPMPMRVNALVAAVNAAINGL
jgi:protein MpaA